MTAQHTGPGHGEADLTLAAKLPDGGLLFQTWTICECRLAGLRARLGPPHQESAHTAETVRATGHAVLQVPGITHVGEGL